jgi:hypothetical protein
MTWLNLGGNASNRPIRNDGAIFLLVVLTKMME